METQFDGSFINSNDKHHTVLYDEPIAIDMQSIHSFIFMKTSKIWLYDKLFQEKEREISLKNLNTSTQKK